MRGGLCAKNQQAVSLSIGEPEQYGAVHTAPEVFGNSERGEGLWHCICVELTSRSHRDDMLGQPLRAGQGKTRPHAEHVANLWENLRGKKNYVA